MLNHVFIVVLFVLCIFREMSWLKNQCKSACTHNIYLALQACAGNQLLKKASQHQTKPPIPCQWTSRCQLKELEKSGNPGEHHGQPLVGTGCLQVPPGQACQVEIASLSLADQGSPCPGHLAGVARPHLAPGAHFKDGDLEFAVAGDFRQDVSAGGIGHNGEVGLVHGNLPVTCASNPAPGSK